MIGAAAYTLMYLGMGLVQVRLLLPRHRMLNRIWLGLSLGLLQEMWLPALGAFLFTFDAAAHVFGAGVLMALGLLCYVARDRRDPRGWDEEENRLLKQILILGLPLTVLSGYLQYTHVMRVDSAGNWHVGQSTYGDLPMHLSFITGLIGKKFPADYPFYPGARLSYPFLTDSLSSTFYLLGASLQAATTVPATLMMALCYTGVLVLGRDCTGGKRTAMLAALLFFLNGGLGFLYDFDLAGGTAGAEEGLGLFDRIGSFIRNWFSTAGERVDQILTGYYKTPTNQPDPNNLRWSNVICDLMIPQRTLLGGWCMGLPCFYLLLSGFRPRQRDPEEGGRGIALLGVWAGALPLIHTHTFLALGLASVGCMTYDMIHGDPKAMTARRSRWEILTPYALYGLLTVLLAAPQLIAFTFAQTFQGEGSNTFLTFQFNWVNNPNGNGMRDLYLWFYIKNIGLPFLALLLALFEKKPRNRRLFAMALPIILAAEFIRFQPNEYDNNKLLYLAWLLCCMIVADWCGTMWQRLKGLRGRYALAGLLAVVTFLSPVLSLWRETVSDYIAYSADTVEAGVYARDHTEKDAVFLTGTQHLNPVLSIAGRTIVCGPNLWLYWHGFNTAERNMDLKDFYEDPETFQEIPELYGADYIYVSSYERSNYDVDQNALEELYEKVFENSEATIYRINGPRDGLNQETKRRKPE